MSTGSAPSHSFAFSARKLLWGGLLAVAAAVVLTVALVAWGSDGESRPLISASFDERTATLTAEISASGMANDERLAVKVDLQTIEPSRGIDDRRPFSFRGGLPLSRAYVGPDPDGDADQELRVPILTGGPYTHIVIEATPSASDAPCTELPTEGSPDEQTACVFVPLLG